MASCAPSAPSVARLVSGTKKPVAFLPAAGDQAVQARVAVVARGHGGFGHGLRQRDDQILNAGQPIAEPVAHAQADQL